jgi:hypothetical protein
MKPRRKRKPQITCGCTGWWFPHRQGCLYCDHYPKPYTEQQWLDHPMNRRNTVQTK